MITFHVGKRVLMIRNHGRWMRFRLPNRRKSDMLDAYNSWPEQHKMHVGLVWTMFLD